VFEGERPHTSANNKLGEFKISGVERARRGEPKVEVEFQMDANGILHVTARYASLRVSHAAYGYKDWW
jgi:heat shock 70kDa protein 1/2/6/8